MKKLISLLVFGFVLAVPLLKIYAQKPFEGTITWSMTMPQMGDDDKHQMVVNVKGNKTETEIDMGAMGIVKTYTNKDTKKSYIVMGAMNTGYIMDMASDSDSKKTGPDIDIKPTGKKETISGHPAEEYLLKEPKGEESIWEASDFPKDLIESSRNSLAENAQRDPGLVKAMKQLSDKGLIPVRIVAKMGGEVAMSMEFVKYEKKNLDDTLFVPPADIKFQPMPKGPPGGGGGMN